jgi:hypothetical protein
MKKKALEKSYQTINQIKLISSLNQVYDVSSKVGPVAQHG